MAEFQLDTAGKAYKSISETSQERVYWEELDAFTQGYITAAFFTDADNFAGEWADTFGTMNPPGFSDLAPEALADMIADCAAFVEKFDKIEDAAVNANAHALNEWPDEATAGRDFWYTRNGHGCGFWDGDWPEPYASELTTAAKAFGEVSLVLGDDGKIYCE